MPGTEISEIYRNLKIDFKGCLAPVFPPVFRSKLPGTEFFLGFRRRPFFILLPGTEIDEFLVSIGLIKADDMEKVEVHSLEQTRKYARLTLPKIDCLGQSMEDITVRVSKFAEGWGIKALIGLDFFRRFRVTVDYTKELISHYAYDKGL